MVGLRKRGSRSVVLETEVSSRGQVSLKDGRWDALGVTIREVGKDLPRIIVYDVPRGVGESELVERIFSQNMEVGSVDDFKRDCRVVFKKGSRNADVVNLILEVTPKVRRDLLGKGRLYMGWASCRVEDYLGISRCFRCQGLGHIAKYCRHREDVCGHCSQTGHRMRDCPGRDAPPECGLCRGFGKKADHMINGMDCPGWKRSVEARVKSIDYGH